MPALEEGNRDEDDDSLLAVAGLDLKNPGVSAKLPSAHRLSQIEIFHVSKCTVPLATRG